MINLRKFAILLIIFVIILSLTSVALAGPGKAPDKSNNVDFVCEDTDGDGIEDTCYIENPSGKRKYF